jgi:hypothetical protein
MYKTELYSDFPGMKLSLKYQGKNVDVGCLRTESESESESECQRLLYDWRFSANQLIVALSPLRLTTSNFIFQLNTWWYSPYVTSSLTRG